MCSFYMAEYIEISNRFAYRHIFIKQYKNIDRTSITACNMEGPVCWGFCPTLCPTASKPKENHTEDSVRL